MKKKYETPDIMCKSFVLSQNIATGDNESGYDYYYSSPSYMSTGGEVIDSDPWGD